MAGPHDDDREAIQDIFRKAGRPEPPSQGGDPPADGGAGGGSGGGGSGGGSSGPADPPGGRARRRQPTRVTLPGISPRAYEHPADQAALTSLRKIPGFDRVLRSFMGFVGERSLRFLYLASAVRVGPRIYPRIHKMLEESCAILDIHPVPEMFVTQHPLVNAGAVGVDQPFIVLHTATVELMSDDEIRFIIGHELGHILSDHVLYKTMLGFILNVSLFRLSLPVIAIYGVRAALMEWHRKSELSCDRAGLLCVQDPQVAYEIHMRMAGGPQSGSGRSELEPFIEQAHEYEASGTLHDSVIKLRSLMDRSHPFHVTRLKALMEWVDSGAYDRIIAGHYPERDDDPGASVYEGLADGMRSYQEAYEQSADPLAQFISDLGKGLNDMGSSAARSIRDFFRGGGGADDEEER